MKLFFWLKCQKYLLLKAVLKRVYPHLHIYFVDARSTRAMFGTHGHSYKDRKKKSVEFDLMLPIYFDGLKKECSKHKKPVTDMIEASQHAIYTFINADLLRERKQERRKKIKGISHFSFTFPVTIQTSGMKITKRHTVIDEEEEEELQDDNEIKVKKVKKKSGEKPKKKETKPKTRKRAAETTKKKESGTKKRKVSKS